MQLEREPSPVSSSLYDTLTLSNDNYHGLSVCFEVAF